MLISLAMLSGTLELGILARIEQSEILTAFAILQCYLSIKYIMKTFKI